MFYLSLERAALKQNPSVATVKLGLLEGRISRFLLYVFPFFCWLIVAVSQFDPAASYFSTFSPFAASNYHFLPSSPDVPVFSDLAHSVFCCRVRGRIFPRETPR